MKLSQKISTRNDFKENLSILRSFLSDLKKERNDNFTLSTKESVADIIENKK